MTSQELKYKTKQLNIHIIKLTNGFPNTSAGFELSKQIIRSSGSVGSNYRAACKAKSRTDLVYKFQIVIEEADETQYWLEVMAETMFLEKAVIKKLWIGYNEVISILTASVKTIQKNASNPKSKI